MTVPPSIQRRRWRIAGRLVALACAVGIGGAVTRWWFAFPTEAHVRSWLRSYPVGAPGLAAARLLAAKGFDVDLSTPNRIGAVRSQGALFSLFEYRVGVVIYVDERGRVVSTNVHSFCIPP
jgi:hypothetical protein